MEEFEDVVPEVLLCSVANEQEASLVVGLLQEDDIPARSDASPGTALFGGLPFEPGHHIFVPQSTAKKAREILSHYPHFKDLKNVHEPEP
jgi:hypothetical protein